MGSKPEEINYSTIKFLCSYGGKIIPRHTDGKLRYTGGHTRVLAIHSSVSFSELMVKLGEFCGFAVTLRCSLPDGDLDTLISIKNDEDLADIIEEYNRASSSLPHPLKIRTILSPPKKVSPSPSSSSSVTHSPYDSPHSSVESPPYLATHHRNCLPAPVVYPIGVRGGAVKGCYTRQFHGSPRFLFRGPYCNNYCH